MKPSSASQPGDRFVVEWLRLDGSRARKKIKPAGKPGKRAADRLAEEVAEQLKRKAGGHVEAKPEPESETEPDPQHELTWDEFVERHDKEWLSSLKLTTRFVRVGILHAFAKIIKPEYVSEVTESDISKYQAQRRSEGLSEATIKGHLAHIKAALGWAVDVVKLIPKAPEIKSPKRAKHKSK